MEKVLVYFKKDRDRTTNLIAILILVFMFAMALLSSRGAFGDPGDSAIVDEVAHIPAGYTYVKDGDYRLNPEHPPLAKAWAALPLVLNKQIVGPESNSSWNDVLQWDAGWYMIYNAGNNPKTVLDESRLPMIILMVVFGFFLFWWARQLYGRKGGLVVLVLFAFYPDILAHGRYVTTDVAAAFGFTVATYLFAKAIEKPTKKSIWLAAAGFALSQLLKFSSLLLFGVFLVLVFVKALIDRDKEEFKISLKQNFKLYLKICLFSLFLVWLVYLPFTRNTPADIEHKLIETNLTSNPDTLVLRNFLHHFENSTITRALGHYLLGVMLVVARVAGGNKTFILGHLSDKSIPWFFPVAWLLKTPVPIILFVISALVTIAIRRPKEKEKIWLLTVIMTPIAVYWAVTLKGQLNIGIRHLMPTVPFVLLLIGYFTTPIINYGKRWAKVIVWLLIVYMVGSTLANYPNFTSYFNEFTPRDQRYQRLTDSSLDWGQDLLRLKKYVDDNKIKNIKVDYFGGSVPKYYIPNSTEWHSSYGPTSGWLAVSATFYQSSKLVGREEGQWSYDWLEAFKPTAIIGDSILVYNITPQQLIEKHPVSPYPITKIDSPSKK